MADLPDPEREDEPQPLQPDAIFSPAGERFEPPLLAAPVLREPPWTVWDVLRIVLVAAVAMFLFAELALVVARAVLGPKVDMSALQYEPRLVVPVMAATYLVVIAFMYGLVSRGYGRPFWSTLRWRFPARLWPAFAAGGVVLAMAIQLIQNLLPVPKELPIDEYFRNAAGAWMMAVFGTVVAPLVEEMFFRGFLYPVLRRGIGVVAGVAVTAFCFALIHESQLAHAWAPLLLLFCVGLVLTITREVSDSVAASVLIHMAYNATLFGIVWVASDHFRHLEKLAQ